MRLVDADVLMKTLGITDMDCGKCAWYDAEWSHCKRGGDFEDACCAIENAPTIQPKKGKWINNKHDLPNCNQCGYMPQFDRAIDDYYYSNYCPNCGADMRGEENER